MQTCNHKFHSFSNMYMHVCLFSFHFTQFLRVICKHCMLNLILFVFVYSTTPISKDIFNVPTSIITFFMEPALYNTNSVKLKA